jgi:hypothetical protein
MPYDSRGVARPCDVLKASIHKDFTRCQVDIHIEPLR